VYKNCVGCWRAIPRRESRRRRREIALEARTGDDVAVNGRKGKELVAPLHEGRACLLVDDDGGITMDAAVIVNRADSDQAALLVRDVADARGHVPGTLVAARGTGLTRR
jgi:hypothetical protein